MRDLLIPDKTILFTGAESMNQSLIAIDAIARAVGDGAGVIYLAETKGEASAFKARVQLILREYQFNPAHNDQVETLPEYRNYLKDDDLPVAIKRRIQSLQDTADPDFPISKFVAFFDGAIEMQPIPAEAPIFAALIEVKDHLPEGTTIVATNHLGSPYLPPQPKAVFPFDVIYECKSRGTTLETQVTMHKPSQEKPFTLEAKIATGGIVTFAEKEGAVL